MQPIEAGLNDWMHRPYDQDMRPAQFFQQVSRRTHDFEKQRDRHYVHEPKRTVPRQKPKAMYKQNSKFRFVILIMEEIIEKEDVQIKEKVAEKA